MRFLDCEMLRGELHWALGKESYRNDNFLRQFDLDEGTYFLLSTYLIAPT